MAQTTSALVRGAAGTGKTTLALAIAVGLAQATGGKVYYLSTEIAPIDVRFKMALLGLPVDAVSPASDANSGALILSEHLLLVNDASSVVPESRMAAALARAERVVLEGLVESTRVVVIDAFSIVGESDQSSSMRGQLAALIQGCDALGISVVLVEEAPVDGPDWSSFVVDLVFELGWGVDPDTTARVRQVSVPKSRFASAAYGPHDYGLDNGRLSVWPDLGSVSHEHLRDAIAVAPPKLMGPSNTLIEGLVGSSYTSGAAPTRLLQSSPWLKVLHVQMRGVARVGMVSVPHSEGPGSLIWAMIRELIGTRYQVVFIQDQEFVLARRRYAVPFFGDLQVLSHLGPMVIVHGSDSELARIPAAFSFAERPREVARPFMLRHLSRLKGTEVDLPVKLEEFRSACAMGGPVPSPELVRWWAIGHAYLMRDRRALDWLMSQGPVALEERPFIRHALVRNGLLKEALKTIDEEPKALHRWLAAELYLGSMTPSGLAHSQSVYLELMSDSSLSAEDHDLLTLQLEEARAARPGG